MIRYHQIYPYSKYQISEKLLTIINNGDHPYSNFSTYPDKLNGCSFDEHLFVFNFLDIANNHEKVTNKKDFNINSIIKDSFKSLMKVKSMESEIREPLTDLTIKIVKEFFNVDDEIDFDIEIVDTIPKEVSNKMEINPVNNEERPELANEIEKRKIINAIQQGGALKTSRIYNLYSSDINNLNPSLIPLYKELIELAYLMYYQITPDDFFDTLDKQKQMQNMMSPTGGDSQDNKLDIPVDGGLFEIRFESDKPTLFARASCFPILLHEAIKGVVEILSLSSLPENEEDAKYVIDKCDNLKCEHYSIIIGGKIWEEFNSLIPYDKAELRSLVFSRIFELPTDEFLNLMNDLFQNIHNEINEEPKEEIKLINEIINNIEYDIYQYTYEDEYRDDDGDNYDDLINDLLN